MKHTIFFLLLCAFSQNVFSANYFIATNGNDSNKGNIESPFATLKQAQSVIESGDTVFFRGGTYHITTDMIMNIRDTYACVFDMAKSGKSANERICYWGYANERPVFDLSAVKPEGLRVSVFYVTGSYLHFKNSEIVGTQVTITGHTQSECISARGGSYNIYELLSMHDGMAIGFYLTKGVDNLLLNCDAYNNYDNYSEGSKGGNVDGFGAHPNNISYTGNIFRGCCAWYNSDDGFDLINAWAPVTIEHCWAFRNGYQPESTASAGDGTGIKAGGYGMSSSATVPSAIPEHVVKNCISYYNRNMGIYANHHLGGIYWENNSAYKNRSNYNMINCKSLAEAVDVDGYEHTLKNNLSYQPRVSGEDLINCNTTLSVLVNNTFYPTVWRVSRPEFIYRNPPS